MTVAWALGTRNRTRLTRPLAPPITFRSKSSPILWSGVIHNRLCWGSIEADFRKARTLGRLVVPTHDILRGEVISTLDLVLRTLTDSRGASILALVGPERAACDPALVLLDERPRLKRLVSARVITRGSPLRSTQAAGAPLSNPHHSPAAPAHIGGARRQGPWLSCTGPCPAPTSHPGRPCARAGLGRRLAMTPAVTSQPMHQGHR